MASHEHSSTDDGQQCCCKENWFGKTAKNMKNIPKEVLILENSTF